MARGWTRDDRVVVVVNEGLPSRRTYEERLAGHADIRVLDEPMVMERRARVSGIVALIGDLARPFFWLRTVVKLLRLFRALDAQVVIVSDGGYPVHDLSWRALCAAALAGIGRRILVVHNYPGAGSTRLRRLAQRMLCQLPPRIATDLVVGSSSLANAIAQDGRASRRPWRIPYGIEDPPSGAADAASLRAAIGVPPDGRLIGAFANVEERKGLRYLIEAMTQVRAAEPEVRAVIVGLPWDRRLDEELRTLVRTLGLADRVVMPGYLEDVQRFLPALELLVIPSLVENFPIVALDAARHACPVVASAVGGLPEAVRDGETGLLVPARDPDALASAILRLLRDPALARELGRRGRERYEREFSATRMAERYRALATVGHV